MMADSNKPSLDSQALRVELGVNRGSPVQIGKLRPQYRNPAYPRHYPQHYPQHYVRLEVEASHVIADLHGILGNQNAHFASNCAIASALYPSSCNNAKVSAPASGGATGISATVFEYLGAGAGWVIPPTST